MPGQFSLSWKLFTVCTCHCDSLLLIYLNMPIFLKIIGANLTEMQKSSLESSFTCILNSSYWVFLMPNFSKAEHKDRVYVFLILFSASFKPLWPTLRGTGSRMGLVMQLDGRGIERRQKWKKVRSSEQNDGRWEDPLFLIKENGDQKVNGDYLHVGLSATVIKDGLSDTMIVQEEEIRDNNPWENVNHNDRLCRWWQWLHPLPEGGEPEVSGWTGEKQQPPLGFNI